MVRLLVWMALYDYWCEKQVRRALVWLDEWLSISQKWAERGMIACYGLCYSAGVFRLSALPMSLRLCSVVAIVFVMWGMHWRAEAGLRALPMDPRMRCVRIGFQFLCGGFAAALLFAPPHSGDDLPQALAQLVYLLFFYSTDIGTDGQRGRKRKLAMEKLKELFGELTWIPKPVPE